MIKKHIKNPKTPTIPANTLPHLHQSKSKTNSPSKIKPNPKLTSKSTHFKNPIFHKPNPKPKTQNPIPKPKSKF